MEDFGSVLAAKETVAGNFWMGHETKDVSFFIAYAGDVLDGAVGIGCGCRLAFDVDVAQQDLPVPVQTLEGLRVGVVTALAMFNRHLEHLTLFYGAGKRRVGLFNAQMNLLANKLQAGVAHQGSGQQTRLAENLKSIANAEYQPTAPRELDDALHDRREPRHRATA